MQQRLSTGSLVGDISILHSAVLLLVTPPPLPLLLSAAMPQGCSLLLAALTFACCAHFCLLP